MSARDLLRVLGIAFAWAMLLGDARADEAQAKLHAAFSEAISELASDIAKYVKSESETDGAIRIGSWEGPAGGGSRISQTLKSLLANQVNVKSFGGYTVSGSYQQDENTEGKHVTVITATIKNPGGNPVQTLPKRLVTDQKLAIELFGANVDLTGASDPDEKQLLEKEKKKPGEQPLGDSEAVAKKVRDRIANPKDNATVFVAPGKSGGAPSIVRFSKDSPYGVELLVRDAKAPTDAPYSACEVGLDGGIPHTDITPQKVYAIRIHNDTGHPVGVSITIDGINLYTFSDNAYWKELGKTLILGSEGTIRGWPTRGAAVEEFTIVSYAESAAGQLGATEGVGSITIVFHPAEISKNATGRGREIDHQLRPVHAVFSDKILGSVSIQYVRPADLPAG